MTLYGYRLTGNAKTAAADYIPSLIGVTTTQTHPTGNDTYFEQVELPEEALAITSLSLSRWVSYDSLPLSERDPIITVKAGTFGFYMPLSELVELLTTFGTDETRSMLSALRQGVV